MSGEALEVFGYKQIKVISFKYTWVLSKLSVLREKLTPILTSPTFSTAYHYDLKWCLELNFEEPTVKFKLKLLSNTMKKTVKVDGKIYILKGEDFIVRNHNINGILPERSGLSYLSINYFVSKDLLLEKLNFLSSDPKISVICEIDTSSESENCCNEIAVPESVLPDTVKLLFENPELSDVTLSVNGKDFKVHKAILAMESPVFKAMFLTNMKENCSNQVKITDMDEDTMKELLRFIYTGKVLDLKEMAEDLLKAADKYSLQRLKDMCESELSKQLSITDAPLIFTVADMYGAQKLKSLAKKFIRVHILDVANTIEWKAMFQEHPSLVEEIFTT